MNWPLEFHDAVYGDATSAPLIEEIQQEMVVRYGGPDETGLARELLSAMEERAARLGYRRVVLETGTPQPEAVALYEAAGYEPIVGFGYEPHTSWE